MILQIRWCPSGRRVCRPQHDALVFVSDVSKLTRSYLATCAIRVGDWKGRYGEGKIARTNGSQ